jgi:hypothetical protein
MQLALTPQAFGFAHSFISRHALFAVNELKPGGQLQLKPPGVFIHAAPSAQGLFTHSSKSGLVIGVD